LTQFTRPKTQWEMRAERAEQDVHELRQTILRLQADIAFKDSLIWSARSSELYNAVVQAEKREAAVLSALDNAIHGMATVVESGDWTVPDDTARQLSGTLEDARAVLTAARKRREQETAL
jgi:hypothetical protein